MALEDYLTPIKFSGPHLCGICQRNIADCPWMHSGKPVPGWTARKTVITWNAPHKNSYHVTACPLYIAPSEERLEEQVRQEREEAEERRGTSNGDGPGAGFHRRAV